MTKAAASGEVKPAQKIVLLDALPAQRLDQIRALLPAGFVLAGATASGDAHLGEIIRDADFAIAGQIGVSRAVLQSATRLKLLHKWGVGVDNLDLEAARQLGIRVARTTGSNAKAVAEFTIGLMLSALRAIPYSHHKLLEGEWHGPARLPVSPQLLGGKTVGIIGLGAIGSEVAKLLSGFGCRILYTKRTPLPATDEETLGVKHASLADLLAQSDVVSLHCPLTQETNGLINSASLATMKPSAVLINVARGGVVVESALYEALSKRIIQAAAMDVFAVEPLAKNSPLLQLDNLVVTPHLAASTADTFEPTLRRIFENMRLVSVGQPIPEKDVVV